tara:strand:- start:1178 stop:1927 length:750 start_codon:yes stop_codon:yes gene_type:complete
MIRNTVAPIPIELLKEYFTDDTIVFNIDYAESILKGEKLITYLSNLDVPSTLTGFDKVSAEDKFSFVKDYMNAKLIIKNYELEVCVLRILYELSGLEWIVDYEEIENILSLEEICVFCQDNQDMIQTWLTMLASLSIFALTTIVDEEEKILDSLKEEFETINDYDFCGANFAMMLRHDATQQLLVAEREVFYFEKQFNEQMYKGQDLYTYWNNDNNTMAIITWGISSGDITFDEFNANIEKGLDDVSAI